LMVERVDDLTVDRVDDRTVENRDDSRVNAGDELPVDGVDDLACLRLGLVFDLELYSGTVNSSVARI
jgi:hypothetical protein